MYRLCPCVNKVRLRFGYKGQNRLLSVWFVFSNIHLTLEKNEEKNVPLENSNFEIIF